MQDHYYWRNYVENKDFWYYEREELATQIPWGTLYILSKSKGYLLSVHNKPKGELTSLLIQNNSFTIEQAQQQAQQYFERIFKLFAFL